MQDKREQDAPFADALLKLGSATLHEAQGQTGAMAAAIKPLDPAWRLVGPALTVEAQPGDNLALHRALTLAQPGQILVVDGGASLDTALWGDILTLAAQVAGVAGLVIDGAVRDSEAIIAMGFPTFSRGIAISGPRKIVPGRINVPVMCGGITVRPEDWIVGDRDGVVAISRSALPQVVAAGKQREAAEAALREGIKAGKSTVELLGLETALRTGHLSA